MIARHHSSPASSQTNVALTRLGRRAVDAVLQNAWLIFMLPHSIIAVSIATAYFTRMSRARPRRTALDELRADVSAVDPRRSA